MIGSRSLRTQLIAVLLLLAVVPLSAIVLYSYLSSQRAFRRAVQAEAGDLAAEMGERLALVRGELHRRVSRLGELPFGALAAAPQGSDPEVTESFLGGLAAAMGDVAPLVEAVEFIPEAPPAPAPVAGAAEAEEVVVNLHPGAGIPPAAAPEGRALRFDLPLGAAPEGSAQAPAPAAPAELAELGVRAALWAAEAVRRELERESASPEDDPAPGLEAPELEGLAERLENLGRRAADAAFAAEAERLAREASQEVVGLVFGEEIGSAVMREGKVVGHVKAQVRAQALLEGVLSSVRRSDDDVPFALDREGNLYLLDESQRPAVEALEPALAADGAHQARATAADWVWATREEPGSGLTFGLARPVAEPLAAIRRTAARNFGLGLAAVALAAIGILPLSARMTRSLGDVTAGAERLARGDLDVRVPVRSNNEFGRLARAFNGMAGDLADNQRRLLDQEVASRLLEAENARKSQELEDARRFQLSLLPKDLPEHPGFEVAVHVRTATEVGGDYYDFHLSPDGVLTAAIGDATGHGAKAGTLVTVIKSLFTAAAPGAELPTFLEEAARTIRRMELGRMSMALALVRLAGTELSVSSAGMPPVLIYRAAQARVEEVELPGVPLGALADPTYDERRLELAPGDAVLLASDGFAELQDAAGDPMGYVRVREEFAAAAPHAPGEAVERLATAAREWSGGGPPSDDVTLVVLRMR